MVKINTATPIEIKTPIETRHNIPILTEMLLKTEALFAPIIIQGNKPTIMPDPILILAQINPHPTEAVRNQVPQAQKNPVLQTALVRAAVIQEVLQTALLQTVHQAVHDQK